MARKSNTKRDLEYLRHSTVANYLNGIADNLEFDAKLDKKTMDQLFGIPPVSYDADMTPIQIVRAHNLHKNRILGWQNRVNRLLGSRGLYMSISWKTNEYFLRSKAATEHKVVGYRRDSFRKMARGEALQRGLNNYASFRYPVAASTFDVNDIKRASASRFVPNGADNGVNGGEYPHNY